MGIQYFEEWAAETRLVREDSLSALGRSGGGPLIGVDAAFFLDWFRHPSKEPLVPALGGFPMALESLIARQVQEIQSFGCKLWFYFDGLECAFENHSFSTSIKTSRTVADAFQIYETGDAMKAMEKFRQVAYPDMATLTAFAKVALHKHGIPFSVAPFKAHAQMIYHLEQGILDAVYGSSELFLYGADKVITKLHLFRQSPRDQEEANGTTKKEPEFVPEKSTFTFIERDSCLKALGDLPTDAFIDALLAAGSSYIRTFPPLMSSQPVSFRQIVDLLGSCQHDIHRLCEHYAHDDSLRQANWEDRFIRAHVAIHHMPVLLGHDSVKPRSALDPARFGRIPGSLHDVIGLALPEELLFYLYQGMIGPRVMNWLISGNVRVHAPLAGGDAPAYRKLVVEQLPLWRREAIMLLASSINRYFQARSITTSYWFGDSASTFDMRAANYSPPPLSTWRVKKQLLQEASSRLSASGAQGPGSLSFALRSLLDATFAAKTKTEKPSTYDPLVEAEEIVANAVWRGLHLRGYVDKTHKLTSWGKLLATAVQNIGSEASQEQAEAAFIAIELIRLGIMDADVSKPTKSENGTQKNDDDSAASQRLVRIATTGQMRHPVRGYSGPLNRQVLSFQSIIVELRNALRDLFEVALAVLFLEASAQRVRDDYTKIAKLLPFQDSPSAGLGLIARTYFDELAGSPSQSEHANQKAIIERAEGWFMHIDVSNSFKDASQLWRAICKSVQSADSAIFSEAQKQSWVRTEKWLSERISGVVD